MIKKYLGIYGYWLDDEDDDLNDYLKYRNKSQKEERLSYQSNLL